MASGKTNANALSSNNPIIGTATLDGYNLLIPYDLTGKRWCVYADVGSQQIGLTEPSGQSILDLDGAFALIGDGLSAYIYAYSFDYIDGDFTGGSVYSVHENDTGIRVYQGNTRIWPQDSGIGLTSFLNHTYTYIIFP